VARLHGLNELSFRTSGVASPNIQATPQKNRPPVKQSPLDEKARTSTAWLAATSYTLDRNFTYLTFNGVSRVPTWLNVGLSEIATWFCWPCRAWLETPTSAAVDSYYVCVLALLSPASERCHCQCYLSPSATHTAAPRRLIIVDSFA